MRIPANPLPIVPLGVNMYHLLYVGVGLVRCVDAPQEEGYLLDR